MTRKVRIAGWIVFLAGVIWFVAAGGIDGFRESPVWTWAAFGTAVTGIALTGVANILDSVARLHRRRAGDANTPPDAPV